MSQEESKRQRQVSALLLEELNEVFQRLNLSMMDGGLVSISNVKVTPDLLEARIYLSFFKVVDTEKVMERINDRSWEIKKELVSRVGKQLRRMPILQFYKDDTLEYVFKMEELMKNIQQESTGNSDLSQ